MNMIRMKMSSRLFIWIVVIIASNLFGIYNVLAGYTQLYYTTAISLMLCVVSLIMMGSNFKQLRFKIQRKREVDRYAALFLILTLVVLVISYFRYSTTQNLVSTIKESLFCFALVLVYYALKMVIKERYSIEFLVNVLIKVSFVCSIFAIIAFVVYTKTGNNILGLNVNDYSFIRNNRGHFMVGSMVVIPATVFLWCRIITGKRSIWTVITLLLNLFHIVYIGQTRMVIATTLIVLVLSYLIVSKRSKKVKTMIVILLIATISVMELQSIKEGINSLMLNNTVLYRLDAMDFYIKQIIENPLFGMGFIESSNRQLSSLLYGPLNRFFRTDVGLIGFVDCLGIFSAIWYISFLLYSIRLISKLRKRTDIVFYEYCFSFTIVIVLGSINLFPIDGYRIIYFPIYMILIHLLEKVDKGLIQNKY